MTRVMGQQGSCVSGLTYIDGDEGVLLHRGYAIEDLAEKADFLELAYLLLEANYQTPMRKKLSTPQSRATQWCMNSYRLFCAAFAVTRIRWPFFVVLLARYQLFTMIRPIFMTRCSA
jgi:citrate synthase